MTSSTAGYVTTGKETGDNSTARVLLRNITIPTGHVIMISCQQLSPHRARLILYRYIKQRDRSTGRLKEMLDTWAFWYAERYDTNYASVHNLESNKILVKVMGGVCITDTNTPCLQLFFSFIPDSKAPQILPTGLWNCSVRHYFSFHHHVACNLKTECEDGRDETEHCPFSSVECQGMVALCDRCYKITSKSIAFKRDVNKWGSEYCNLYEGTMRFPTCLYDLYGTIVSKLKRFWGYRLCLFAGFTSGDLSLPNMYRYSMCNDKNVFHHLFDGTIVCDPFGTKHCHIYAGGKLCFCLSLQQMSIHIRKCLEQLTTIVICEVTTNKTKNIFHFQKAIPLPNTQILLSTAQGYLTAYDSGQLTHTFLFCSYKQDSQAIPPPCYFAHQSSHEKIFHSASFNMTTPLFPCRNGKTSLSYTLVCDFIIDCSDSSDEFFCHHHLCSNMFTCTNGQCLSFDNVCDQLSHCWDGSEEDICYVLKPEVIPHTRFPSPALIHFDSAKQFKMIQMNFSESCPDSHYRCPGEFNDCLPMYTRCNGMHDCTGQQDEEGCEEMTCPGFFRCRVSKICVHSDHMCDGWPHCPKYDDELACTSICPVGCLCQGLAFLCPQNFYAEFFPQLRSLNATGSGLTLSDMSSNAYLVHLALAKCSLTCLPEVKLLNLRVLDLSDNKLQHINMTSFLALENVQSLSLSNNPITSLYAVRSSVIQSELTVMDLSHTTLTAFDSKVLEQFSHLNKLNLTSTSIHTIGPGGFRFTPQLMELYLDGSPVTTFPPDIFQDLFYLHFLSTDSYKLCCNEVFPDNQDTFSCDAPKDEISSCEDLLQLWIYRGFLWLFACLAVCGNMFCFCARMFSGTKTTASGFSVFVTSLTMADFLMGVYMAVIGVADEWFRGRYVHHDDTWKNSVTCKVAGLLSLLSSEVSALIICVITFDRFVALCFPFSTLRFNRTSASMVSLLIWLIGWFLALLPLLPMTSHWEFYSQIGICIPLPVTRQEFKGKVYSIGVLIFFNFALFLLISVGQACIYWSIQKNALKINTTRVSQDMAIARRLITIALTDFMCWFPIGMCGLLAMAGVPIPGEVSVALAIFVLPLNSAVNPFMYTFNTLAEKRRLIKESKLLTWMECHADADLIQR